MRAWTRGLICPLILGFAAYQAQGVEPDPCIPPDTIFAMKVRPRQILTSALVKDLGWDELFKTTVAAIGPVQEFLDTAGLRIERDVESVLWCMSSSPVVHTADPQPATRDPETGEIIQNQIAGERPAKPWMIVVQGKFNSKKVQKALENHGKSAGAPVRKLKGEGTTLVQMESPLGPIFLGFDNSGKIMVSNQLERLKGAIVGVHEKPASSKFVDGLESLTDKESLWIVHSIDGDLKKQMEGPSAIPQRQAFKEMKFWQCFMTLSDGIEGKVIFATTSPRHAESIKAALSFELIEIEKRLADYLDKPGEQKFPEETLERAGGGAEVAIAYLAVKQAKLEVKGNDTVLQIKANRKSLEPLLQAFGLLFK